MEASARNVFFGGDDGDAVDGGIENEENGRGLESTSQPMDGNDCLEEWRRRNRVKNCQDE